MTNENESTKLFHQTIDEIVKKIDYLITDKKEWNKVIILKDINGDINMNVGRSENHFFANCTEYPVTGIGATLQEAIIRAMIGLKI